MTGTPTFSVVFDYDSASATFKKWILTDTYDYVGDGVALTDVVGFFRITSPLGLYYQGVVSPPDIDADISLVFNTLAIPYAQSSPYRMLLGEYTFQYSVVILGVQYDSAVITFELCPPTTVVATNGLIQDACLTVEINCFCQKITLTDETVYGDTSDLDRSITLHPPSIASEADTVVTGPLLEYIFSWVNSGYEFLLDSLAEYTEGVVIVNIRLQYQKYQVVNCGKMSAKMAECMIRFVEYFHRNANNTGFANTMAFRNLLNDTVAVINLYNGYTAALQTGNWTKVESLHTLLESIMQTYISCDCGCSSDVPAFVDPYCGVAGSATAYSFSGTAPVDVDVSGNVVTYSLSPAFVALVYSLLIDALASSDGSVSISSSILGSTKTWQLTVKNSFAFRALIEYTSGSNLSVTVSNETRQGSRYVAALPANAVQAVGYPFASAAALEAADAVFYVEGFLTTPGVVTDKVDLSEMLIQLSGAAVDDYTQPSPFMVELVTGPSATKIFFRLVDAVDGEPVSMDRFVNEVEAFYFTCKINQ